MNLDIEVQQSAVLLHLPVRAPGSQLYRLVTSFCSDLATDASAEMFDALFEGKALSMPLPLNNWRRVLARVSRFHDVMRDPANQGRFFERLSTEAQQCYDREPMTFTVDGIAYSSPRDIPGPADISVALGTFELSTETVLLTDPCYEKGTWCTGELRARTGTWNAQVLQRDNKYGGYRNARLTMAHESVRLHEVHPENMENSGIDVGVDSGQAGFFEKSRYPDDKAQLESEDGTWYSEVCDITLEGEGAGAGICPGGFGVVSLTFWGDGGYPCFVRKNDAGQVVAAVLVFDGSMPTEESDENEE